LVLVGVPLKNNSRNQWYSHQHQVLIMYFPALPHGFALWKSHSLSPSYWSKQAGISSVIPNFVGLLAFQVLWRHIQDSGSSMPGFPLAPLQNSALRLLKVSGSIIQLSLVEGRKRTTWSSKALTKMLLMKPPNESDTFVSNCKITSPVPRPENWDHCFASPTWITMHLGPSIKKTAEAHYLSKVLPTDLSV